MKPWINTGILPSSKSSVEILALHYIRAQQKQKEAQKLIITNMKLRPNQALIYQTFTDCLVA